MRKKIFLILMASCFSFASAQEKDILEGKDHPMISRYDGSVIMGYAFQEYGELVMPLGKAVLNKNVEYLKNQRAEGKLTRILYLAPQKRSTLEIYKNYEIELRKAGFENLFSCSGDEDCGRLFHQAVWSREKALKNSRSLEYVFATPSDQRMLVAKLSRPERDVYVLLYIAVNDQSKPKWATARTITKKSQVCCRISCLRLQNKRKKAQRIWRRPSCSGSIQ